MTIKDKHLTKPIMKKIIVLIVVTVVGILIFAACQDSDSLTSKSSSQIAVPSSSTRTFFMTTAKHFGYSSAQIKEGAQFVKDHSDIASIALGGGVPWDEALADKGYPASQDAYVDILKKEYKNIPIVLSIGFSHTIDNDLNNDLDENGSGIPRTGIWKDMEYNDPRAIKAYTNYCRHLIENVKPDYFMYAGEVNLGLKSPNDPRLAKMLTLMERVYTTLKREYPDLPIFVSIANRYGAGHGTSFLNMTEQLLRYSDLIGLTSFPYINNPPYRNPADIPADWYTRIQDLAPKKRLALMELSTPGADLKSGGVIAIPANEEWQATFIEKTFTEMNELNAEIIIWSPSAEDLDNLFPGGTIDPSTKLWLRNGLMDKNGNPRKGYNIWMSWLEQ